VGVGEEWEVVVVDVEKVTMDTRMGEKKEWVVWDKEVDLAILSAVTALMEVLEEALAVEVDMVTKGEVVIVTKGEVVMVMVEDLTVEEEEDLVMEVDLAVEVALVVWMVLGMEGALEAGEASVMEEVWGEVAMVIKGVRDMVTEVVLENAMGVVTKLDMFLMLTNVL